MNKTVVSIVISLLVGLGVGFALPHGATPGGQRIVGAVYEPNPSHYSSGLYAGSTDQWSVDGSGNVNTTGAITATGNVTGAAFKLPASTFATSSSSPAALGAAINGQIVVAASATTANASTTAIANNSLIFYENSATTTIPGVTCNTALASSTQTSTKIAGNGFILKVSPAPTTNPYCFDFHIVNP